MTWRKLALFVLLGAVALGLAQAKGKNPPLSTWSVWEPGSEGGPLFVCTSVNGVQTCSAVVRTIAKFTPENDVKVLRVQHQHAKWVQSFNGSYSLRPGMQDGTPCGVKAPKLTVTDGVSSHTLTLSEVSNDSGPLALTFPAGTTIRVEVTAGAVPLIVGGLNVNPICTSVLPGNLTIQYTTSENDKHK